MTVAAPLGDAALDTLFREARTFNHYTDEPVAEADLRAIWELMKWGPTSANSMPARLIWCVSAEAKTKLAALSSGSNGAKIRAAPVAVIVGMDMQFHDHLPALYPHADAKSWFTGNDDLIARTAFRNSSLQGAYFIIAARALGLDVGPMSGFDNDAVDTAFFAGTSNKSNFIATLGHGDRATLHDRSPRPEFERFNTVA